MQPLMVRILIYTFYNLEKSHNNLKYTQTLISIIFLLCVRCVEFVQKNSFLCIPLCLCTTTVECTPHAVPQKVPFSLRIRTWDQVRPRQRTIPPSNTVWDQKQDKYTARTKGTKEALLKKQWQSLNLLMDTCKRLAGTFSKRRPCGDLRPTFSKLFNLALTFTYWSRTWYFVGPKPKLWYWCPKVTPSFWWHLFSILKLSTGECNNAKVSHY